MPLVIAAVSALGRQVVLMAVTLGVITVAEKVIIDPLRYVISQVMQAFGVSEDEATDIVANEWIDLAIQIGIGAVALKTRLPLKVADMLKFTTKGTAKRKLPAATEAKVAAAKNTTVSAAAKTDEAIEVAAQGLAAAGRTTLSKANDVASLIVKIVGVPVGVGLLVTNTIDFGAWNSSAYQSSFQKFLGLFGLKPDEATAKPRTVSQDVYNKVYFALKNKGAVRINNPYTGETVPYTDANFLAVVDKLASHIFIESGSVSAKQLLGAALAVVEMEGQTKPSGGSVSVTSTQAVTQAATQTKADIKVFTGIVANGAFSAPKDFVPEQDDLIQSEQELMTVIKHNLAGFIAALPSRFYYEVGIVNSVRTREGFTQKGAPVKVISGYTTKGEPRYKTIYHKYAEMRISVDDEDGKRHRLASIVLGPINPADFTLTNEQLNALAGGISDQTFTVDIPLQTGYTDTTPTETNAQSGSQSPVSTTPSTSSPVEPTAAQLAARLNPVPVTVYVPKGGLATDSVSQERIYTTRDNGRIAIFYVQSVLTAQERDEVNQQGGDGLRFVRAGQAKLRSVYGLDVNTLPRVNPADIQQQAFQRNGAAANGTPAYDTIDTSELFNAQSASLTPIVLNDVGTLDVSAAPISTAQATAAKKASTLQQYYDALGLALPPLNKRAIIYEAAGFGQASLYVGNEAQNAKLLAYLKSSA